MGQCGTSNTSWEQIKEAWYELVKQDQLAQGTTSNKQAEQASLRAQEIINNLQDWLVGSTTSQDDLRAIYIGMGNDDRVLFAAVWRRCLNERDYSFDRFQQECFPVAALRQQRDRIEELEQLTNDQKEQLEKAIETVTARDRSLTEAEQKLAETKAQLDTRTKEFVQLTLTHSIALNEYEQACQAIGQQATEITRLKAQLWDLSQKAQRLADLSDRITQRAPIVDSERLMAGLEALGVEVPVGDEQLADARSDEPMAQFQLDNCARCKFADKDRVGTAAPCCTFPGKLEQRGDVCLVGARAGDAAHEGAYSVACAQPNCMACRS